MGEEMHKEVLALVRQLRSQRMIKIFIGDDTEPYLMSETSLVNASKYFDGALKHEHLLGATEPGVLRFPEDEELRDAWEIMLYWIINKQLPPAYTHQDDHDTEHEAVEPWVRTWVLADKYFIPELQDTVMLELLQHFCENGFAGGPEDAEMANRMLRITPIASPIRRLITEEIVDSTYGGNLSFDDLMGSDGTPGLSGSIMAACRDYINNKHRYPRQNQDDDDAKLKAWKEYLVRHLPLRHWVYDQLPELGLDWPEEEQKKK